MFRKEIFCIRLRELRQSRKLTLEQLAKDLDFVKQTLSNYETGNRAPSLEASIALADYFNVSLDYLVGRSDTPERD